MKKEKCEKCGKLVDKNKIDEHHTNKKKNPKEKIRVCKDCHFKIHHGEKMKEQNVFKRGVVKMPKKVLYDKRLSSSAKVLYMILSEMCELNGYCETNNNEISSIMAITKTQSSRLFSQIDRYLEIENRTMPVRKIMLIK